MSRIRDKIAAMKCGVLFLLLCSFTAFLPAQTVFEIHGTVSEPGLGGIAGAEVQAILVGAYEERLTLRAFTDGRGQFIIRPTSPGSYMFFPRVEGYGPFNDARTFLDAEHPLAEVQLFMIRPAQATGRVLDAETREPMEGILVSVMQKNSGVSGSTWRPTQTMAPTGNTLDERMQAMSRYLDGQKTKQDGSFRIDGLRPGEYSVTVLRDDESPWTSDYSDEEFKVIDRGFEKLYWPGGLPGDVVRPIQVGSGAVVSFGDIWLK
jgi:hypothetical protein